MTSGKDFLKSHVVSSPKKLRGAASVVKAFWWIFSCASGKIKFLLFYCMNIIGNKLTLKTLFSDTNCCELKIVSVWFMVIHLKPGQNVFSPSVPRVYRVILPAAPVKSAPMLLLPKWLGLTRFHVALLPAMSFWNVNCVSKKHTTLKRYSY